MDISKLYDFIEEMLMLKRESDAKKLISKLTKLQVNSVGRIRGESQEGGRVDVELVAISFAIFFSIARQHEKQV